MIDTAVGPFPLTIVEPEALDPEPPERGTPTETPERLTPAETPERITPAEPPERLTPAEPPERQTPAYDTRSSTDRGMACVLKKATKRSTITSSRASKR
jgi:hypothetical protein